MSLPDLDKLSKDRRDWLEVYGNQWAPVKMMPGTCEACVWGRGEHAEGCVDWRRFGKVTITERVRVTVPYFEYNPLNGIPVG